MGSIGAVNYTALIIKDGGDKYECHTSNMSCSVADLMCGSQYSMTVTANGAYCSSNNSHAHSFQTAPCSPQNVTASVNCVTNVAIIGWEPSPGGDNYTALAIAPDGENYVCHSTTTSCDIAGLMCGQKYLVTVSAASKDSSSKASQPIDLHTAPCATIMETPQLNCSNNSASMSWSQTPGAISYVANVSSPGAEMLSCHTSSMGCIINQLQCGQIYNATVTAINQQCTGPAAIPVTLTTAPCQPHNVAADINCSSSVIRLSWDESLGAQSYYSVLRTPENQYLLCNNTELGCEIRDLPCGQAYDVTVTAVNDRCESAPSSPSALYTVPCVPSQVQADMNCESNVVTVSWAKTVGAVNYTTVTIGPQGEQHHCQSSNTSCSFTQLSCGLRLEASVAAVGNTCTSDFSLSVPFYTAPCAPVDVHPSLNCTDNSALVSWGVSPGASNYTLSMNSSYGNRQCSSNDTRCRVHDLECGESYAVAVNAHNEVCSSEGSRDTQLLTEKCFCLLKKTYTALKCNNAV
ncbi:fibronectin type III domain-containing protein 7-like [Dendrobates tinctorius]|uniref:fibronectin type III domain-containing protein 7-like n=1 Tax=Dendrobates tinctorius TaxID=92724 RepID=UPI003CC96D5F